MKLTKTHLKNLIKEELEAEFNPTDEWRKEFDPNLDQMREAMQNIALSVIDQYSSDSEKYGEFTKEAARKEIKQVLEAALDNFINDDLVDSPGLETILDEKFDE